MEVSAFTWHRSFFPYRKHPGPTNQNHSPMNKTTLLPSAVGYDAPGKTQEEDHLNRWVFAHEIYRIATEGPLEWAVRIGVYGEWGTGKSTVLNFIQKMAERDGQLFVYFNPWQYKEIGELWKAFATTLYEEKDKAVIASQEDKVKRKIKGTMGNITKIAQKGLNKTKFESIGNGLEALKCLRYGKGDFKDFRHGLENRRVIIAIDDLDRTDPKFVPEMLFALKEILEIPGVAFVCAFDPNVVGEVLANFHPGFKSGLKFLEKIIDYPRWLPEPTTKQFTELALSEYSLHCSFVPESLFVGTIPLLPENPRAIRQFIRLLSLLRHQINRHHKSEIEWSILLPANVIKVRFPQLSPPFLVSTDFWNPIHTAPAPSDGSKKSLKERIRDECQKLLERLPKEQRIAPKDLDTLAECLLMISAETYPWFGMMQDQLLYQFQISEQPRAVTLVEFEAFGLSIKESKDEGWAAKNWIEKHAAKFNRTKEDVFCGLFDNATRSLRSLLEGTSDEIETGELEVLCRKEQELIKILDLLSFSIGGCSTETPLLNETHLLNLFEAIVKRSFWTDAQWKEANAVEEEFLRRICSQWKGNIFTLVNVLGLNPYSGKGEFRGCIPSRMVLIQELRTILRQRVADWGLSQFQQTPRLFDNLCIENRGDSLHEVFMHPDGCLWKDRRTRILELLSTATSNIVVRQNAFGMLSRFSRFYNDNRSVAEREPIKNLLSDPEIGPSLWQAATSVPLNPQGVGYLRFVEDLLREENVLPPLPPWWNERIEFLKRLDPKFSAVKNWSGWSI